MKGIFFAKIINIRTVLDEYSQCLGCLAEGWQERSYVLHRYDPRRNWSRLMASIDSSYVVVLYTVLMCGYLYLWIGVVKVYVRLTLMGICNAYNMGRFRLIDCVIACHLLLFSYRDNILYFVSVCKSKLIV